MQLHTITDLLAIPNYHVSHMVVHSDSRLDLLLEPSAFTPAICSGCGRLHNTPIHSIGMIVVEDLPISGKRVFLHVPKRKSLCIEDDRIRTEELAWLKGRFTKRLAEQGDRLIPTILAYLVLGAFLAVPYSIWSRRRIKLEGAA